MTSIQFIEYLRRISNAIPIDERIHGGKNALKKYNKEKIVDFSVCINPFISPNILSDLDKVKIGEYPDPNCLELKKTISNLYKISIDNIVVGNGSAEIISLLFFCFVRAGDRIAALWPSFEEYKYYTEVTKSKFIPITFFGSDFSLDSDYVIKKINQEKPKLFFLCNPVNPIGKYFDQGVIENIIKNLSEETLIILDEAYVNFVIDAWNSVYLLKRFKNLVILRSLTKDYALTNLRLGYSLAHIQVAKYLNSAITCWSVNGLAQQIGASSLKNKNLLVRSIKLIHKEKERVEKELGCLGYYVVPSTTNYYLLKVKSAKYASRLLLNRNIYVRDCSSYDLPLYLRISVKTPRENDRLISALKEVSKKIIP